MEHLYKSVKATVNQVSKLDNHPTPKIDHLFAQLTGGKKARHVASIPAVGSGGGFPKIRGDINTHRGLQLSSPWDFSESDSGPLQWYSRGGGLHPQLFSSIFGWVLRTSN